MNTSFASKTPRKSQSLTSGKTLIRRSNGFTLVELLVVVAIVSLLAAILFPVFGRVRENARRASCQSNLKQIALATLLYAQEWDERMPTRTAIGNIDIHTRLQPYIKSANIFKCPSQTKYYDKNTGVEKAVTSTYFSYSYSSELSGAGAFGNFQGLIGVIPFPSRTVMVAEQRGMQDRVSPVGGVGGPAFEVNPNHFYGANLAFVDGHVKWLPIDDPGLNQISTVTGTYWQPTASKP